MKRFRTILFCLTVFTFAITLVACGEILEVEIPTINEADFIEGIDVASREDAEETQEPTPAPAPELQPEVPPVTEGSESNIPVIQNSVGNFTLGMSPQTLLQILAEKGMELITSPYQDWEYIEYNVENPVRDGRTYNIGTDFSFDFTTEDAIFRYCFEGIHRDISIRTARFNTTGSVGVGDSRASVIAAHGDNFREKSGFIGSILEYSNAGVYLQFTFDGNAVWMWTISTRSLFE